MFLGITTEETQQSSSSPGYSPSYGSAYIGSFLEQSLASSSISPEGSLLETAQPAPLTGDTTVPFSVTVGGTTAFCQLSFSTDFVCISYAGVTAYYRDYSVLITMLFQVSCQLVSADGALAHLGQVDHPLDFVTKIGTTVCSKLVLHLQLCRWSCL